MNESVEAFIAVQQPIYCPLSMAELTATEITRDSLLAELDFRRVEATAKLDPPFRRAVEELEH